ncbi:cation:proton antiporter [Fimbriimonas ginsengisoli]|uniref:Na+/H+ antiporter n=1 Tax=Fimbriimonas ginsengisoli Gsoil 348 TaxID=661478 RepID=A0A068NWW4_FIMGI|nr:cation:proton antiporter [Fimbriimonas ginsengisoli]AIE86074.1 Na+/H+ antiporter [Fimbriimonas ginsengisoli Gsoil 348]
MGITVENMAWLLLLATIVAIGARRFRLPYSVGLLGAGVLIALSPLTPNVVPTKELIFTLFLPPLIFESAFLLRWDELRRDMAPLVLMATVGVIASAVVIYFGMTRLLGWDWRAALMFSTLISATDPVAVVAMLKEAKATGRFRLIIEAESLFNDGTAAALFVVALSVVGGQDSSPLAATATFLKVAGGGLACGGLVGGLVLFLMGRTEDHLVEIACTVVAAFGSFLFAEHFGFSGVLATVVAGLMLGNIGPLRVLSAKGRDDAETFWEFGAFAANSVLFLLMGSQLAKMSYMPFLSAMGIAVLLILLGRAAAVYGVMAFFGRSRHRLDWLSQHLLVWGGLRGALGMALALGLPANLPMRGEVLAVVFAVVAFSTVVQGITIRPALAKLPDQAI